MKGFQRLSSAVKKSVAWNLRDVEHLCTHVECKTAVQSRQCTHPSMTGLFRRFKLAVEIALNQMRHVLAPTVTAAGKAIAHHIESYHDRVSACSCLMPGRICMLQLQIEMGTHKNYFSGLTILIGPDDLNLSAPAVLMQHAILYSTKAAVARKSVM